MNNQLQRNLEHARLDLLSWQNYIRESRQIGRDLSPGSYGILGFYVALDRAWEAQCMAQGSL